MGQRFVVIWFRHLATDWWGNRRPELKVVSLVLVQPERGRMIVAAVNVQASIQKITVGMALADARALVPELHVEDYSGELVTRLLKKFAEWCIKYTPFVALDDNRGLILDVTGCAHLWGGDFNYLKEIITQIRAKGYNARGAMASTIGMAWANCHYGRLNPIILPGQEREVLSSMHAAALRLDGSILELLVKLGLSEIGSFISMHRSALRRRFDQQLLRRLDQALGNQQEIVQPVIPIVLYHERLPCLEPIRTRKGIEIALQKLLEGLCNRLAREGKGLRKAILKGHRIDGQLVSVSIGTSMASHHEEHLFKLFSLEIGNIRPELGIELFILEAPVVEEVDANQQSIWNAATGGLEDSKVAELLDRIAGKIGTDAIHRFLPDKHHWPERSVAATKSLSEETAIPWQDDRLRPVVLLPSPALITVTAPIPDYPPMLFRYCDKIHRIKKADGPERIEAEWWMEDGEHRDYYCVEDTEGKRYWVFRLGHYHESQPPDWYLHGFFA